MRSNSSEKRKNHQIFKVDLPFDSGMTVHTYERFGTFHTFHCSDAVCFDWWCFRSKTSAPQKNSK